MAAGYADFCFYRVEVERAHLVAGFGRIHRLEAETFPFDAGDAGPLFESEEAVVGHMNADHADVVQLYASRLVGLDGGWLVSGVGSEGCDLRRGGETARLTFDRPVFDAEGARAELVRLVKRARS